MRILILLIAVAGVVGCGDSNTQIKKELPLEVYKLHQANQYDTITVIKTKGYWHLYEKGEYKESINLTHLPGGFWILVTIVIILLCLLFILKFTE